MDHVYTDAYFAYIEACSAASASIIANSILADWHPASVIDVGCGTGALLHALKVRACRALGLEYASSALNACRNRNLDVRRFDLERDVLETGPTFDVAVCMEVAEHLHEPFADRLVTLLCQLAPRVVFTAAPPGQGGAHHVNEQPPTYWIAKFVRHGCVLETEMTDRWKGDWEASGCVASFYSQNLMLFDRRRPE